MAHRPSGSNFYSCHPAGSPLRNPALSPKFCPDRGASRVLRVNEAGGSISHLFYIEHVLSLKINSLIEWDMCALVFGKVCLNRRET